MPRKEKYTASFESLLDVSPSQLESMTRRDLAQAVTRMRDAAQKRLKRIEKADIYSPSAEYIKRSGGLETVRGKDVTDLRNQYLRLKGFLENKTSTVKGTREYQKKQKEIIAEEAGTTVKEMESKLTDEQYGQIWQLIDRAGDSGVIDRKNYGKYIQSAITAIMKAPSTDLNDIYKVFADNVEEEYKKEIAQDITVGAVSQFFKK